MPTLNEYLGSIISSLNTARVMADIQTVKVAQDYAKHELLQHFSVPRMKIDDVEITIPVAIESADQVLEEPVDIINNKQFNSDTYALVARSVGRDSLPREVSSKVRSVISRYTRQLETDVNQLRSNQPIKQYAASLNEELQGVFEETKLEYNREKAANSNLASELANLANQEVTAALGKTRLGDMNVIAEAHLLKEQDADKILQIKLKVSEDSMEWQKMELDGEITSKLLPE